MQLLSVSGMNMSSLDVVSESWAGAVGYDPAAVRRRLILFDAARRRRVSLLSS